MTNPKPTKAPEPWLKRNRLDLDKARAKSTVKPALLAMAGAVAGGGIASAIPPLASGIGGAACIFAGIYSGKHWLAAAGAAMLTSTAHLTLGGSGLRTSGGGTDMKSVIEGGKERITAFGKAFAGKFIPVKDDAGQALSGLGDPHMLLDDIERSIEASAMEHKSTVRTLPAPPGTLPGKAPDFERY
jgi:hypothetical protein